MLLGAVSTVFVSIVVGILRSELGYSLAIYGNNPHFFRNHNMSGTLRRLFCGLCLGMPVRLYLAFYLPS